MQTLSKLFGSEARVKILRLFLLNQSRAFSLPEIASRTRVTSREVRREIDTLVKAKFIQPKKFTETRTVETKNKRTKKIASRKISRRVSGFVFQVGFPYVEPLANLLFNSDFLKQADLIGRFKKSGKIKLLVISGIFIDSDARMDVLLVGDNLKRSVFDRTIKVLESEIGRELTYAIFDTPEFLYRLNMYDKLVRDVFDYPHATLIDTVGLSTQAQKK